MQRFKQSGKYIISVIFVIFMVLIIGGYIWPSIPPFSWAGVREYIPPQPPSTVGYERTKTLWNWMELVTVSAVLAAGALWFNQIEQQRKKHQEELDREFENDRMQVSMLQTYLDRMGELLLEKGLLNKDSAKQEGSQIVRDIARARTLTVLRSLDTERKATILRFLYESDLITQRSLIFFGKSQIDVAVYKRATM